ncbi:hypothetical protein [Oceanivirga salmonicida]|uniref:hypothetical protein n=1 Tax=Oceanivirga salmonicida TaxID=1769291 RepID=UPI0008342332|nr:hypothetical protein [Oceanivirga salmonicida]
MIKKIILGLTLGVSLFSCSFSSTNINKTNVKIEKERYPRKFSNSSVKLDNVCNSKEIFYDEFNQEYVFCHDNYKEYNLAINYYETGRQDIKLNKITTVDDFIINDYLLLKSEDNKIKVERLNDKWKITKNGKVTKLYSEKQDYKLFKTFYTLINEPIYMYSKDNLENAVMETKKGIFMLKRVKSKNDLTLKSDDGKVVLNYIKDKTSTVKIEKEMLMIFDEKLKYTSYAYINQNEFLQVHIAILNDKTLLLKSGDNVMECEKFQRISPEKNEYISNDGILKIIIKQHAMEMIINKKAETIKLNFSEIRF